MTPASKKRLPRGFFDNGRFFVEALYFKSVHLEYFCMNHGSDSDPKKELRATVSNEKFKKETLLIPATPLPSVQHTSSCRLRTAQISCRNSKLELISQSDSLKHSSERATGMYSDHHRPTHTTHTTHPFLWI